MGYKIGSFNCLNFGRGNINKDVKTIAKIISNEQFDIVALQEIKGQPALNRLLYELNFSRGSWKGVADDGSANDYAFIWNTDRVDLARTKANGIERQSQPHIYKQYKIDKDKFQRRLIREPFYARFIPNSPGMPKFEIRILNAHIRFSKGKEDNSEDDNSIGAIAMRRNELSILAETLYPKVADKRYGNFLPAYTILLGDYNLNKPTSGAKAPYLEEVFEINEGKKTKRIITEQNELTTLKKPSNEPKEESDETNQNVYSNNYDHFTYDENRFNGTSIKIEKIDTVKKYCKDDFQEHIKNISDHVPIQMDFDVRGGKML